MTLTTVKIHKFPIIEVYGPVFEGEGPLAGALTFFVRLGGCDFRCTHCDSMYAVMPNEVKENSTWMVPSDIATKLINSRGGCDWVTISGGNPALFKHGQEILDELHGMKFKVKVETQGSVWNDWLGNVDMLIISPKTPGFAGEAWAEENAKAFPDFMYKVRETKVNHAVKIVIDTPADILYAREIAQENELESLWLSCCTHLDDDRDSLGDRFRELGEAVEEGFRDLNHLPDLQRIDLRWSFQQHVFAYGHKRGV